MPNVDIRKFVSSLGDNSVVNLDLPIREVLASEAVGILTAADEPWEGICADWMMLFHRGPHFSLGEYAGLQQSLRDSLSIADSIQGRLKGLTAD